MKGKIQIVAIKSGFEARIEAENGKIYKPSAFAIEQVDDDKNCEFELDKGLVVKVFISGEECKMKPRKIPASVTGKSTSFSAGKRMNLSTKGSGPTGQHGGGHTTRVRIDELTARAPYNFIPLNEDVVPFEAPPKMNRYCEGRHSGYIDLLIETITPLYIRGTSKNTDQVDNTSSDFFSPGHIFKIPGSTLRGMVRELVEIVSFGKFACDDHQLFFRNIGDAYYRDAMIDIGNNCSPRAKAGLLYKQGSRYYIRPSQNILGTDHYRINGKFIGEDFFITGIRGALKQFTFSRIFFKPVSPMNHQHLDTQGRAFQLRYALISSVSLTEQPGFIEGYLIISGKFGSKKHMQWIINMPQEEGAMEVPEAVLKCYNADVSRVAEADIFDMLAKHCAVPCFYLTDAQGIVTALGHTGLFRHPYQYSVHKHFGESLRSANTIDCAESIFGKLEHWTGRLFFEDAELESGQQDVYMEPVSPKILSGPKATTYQHYLAPSSTGHAQHWGVRSAKLSGYKLYWHRNTMVRDKHHWSEGEKIEDRQHTIICPINPNKRFKGRIRFENLSAVELGAILFVLNLPEQCRHKLGMGKPLGLGSVKIIPDLVLFDRNLRYRKLFSNNFWSLPETSGQITIFINAFEKFMFEKISDQERNESHRLWDITRLKKLKAMLDWNNTLHPSWNEKTSYMEIELGKTATARGINEYKKRPVLPDPLEVIK